MAETDDRGNLEDDLGQRRRQFLLELSSARQDRVPSRGISFARLMQSNDAISCYNITVPFAYSISASWVGHAGHEKGQLNVQELTYVYHVPP